MFKFTLEKFLEILNNFLKFWAPPELGYSDQFLIAPLSFLISKFIKKIYNQYINKSIYLEFNVKNSNLDFQYF